MLLNNKGARPNHLARKKKLKKNNNSRILAKFKKKKNENEEGYIRVFKIWL